MREVEIKVYTFEELNESAKERARDWWRGHGADWCDETNESITAFLDKFDVELREYRIDWGSYNYQLSDYDNNTFRGMKLKDFVREEYLTGYCVDADLSITFYDTFEKTGDAMYAFKQAVDAGFEAWYRDIEYQGTNEYIDEALVANEYEFTADGEIY